MSIRDERFTELEEYIAAGYGDTRPSKIPKDWRTRIPAMQVSEFFTEKPQPVEKRRSRVEKPPMDQNAAVVLQNELARQSTAHSGPRKQYGPRHSFSRESKEAQMRARIAAGKLPKPKPPQRQPKRRNEYLLEVGRIEAV